MSPYLHFWHIYPIEIALENRLHIDKITIIPIPYDPPKELVIKEAIVKIPSFPP